MEKKEAIARLQLARTERIGPLTFQRLLQKFGSAEQVLKYLPNIGKQKIQPFAKARAEDEWARTESLGGRMLIYGADDYPLYLKYIPAPPPVLTVFGHVHLLNEKSFAIVGARDASLNSTKLAFRFGEVLSHRGLKIVSGMARGIDTSAHKGALFAQQGTITVLAGGADVIYPSENESLYHEIKAVGAVVSEAPLGTQPIAHHFPKRNRLISGLSLGVLVIEAALHSGTLITAQFAMEQGREVFAVPGSPMDSRMRGCNDLLKQGAHLTETPDDIMPILQGLPPILGEHHYQDEEFLASAPLSDKEISTGKATICRLLSSAPTSMDELWRASSLSRALFNQSILELELAGDISNLWGDHFCLNIKQNSDGQIHGLF